MKQGKVWKTANYDEEEVLFDLEYNLGNGRRLYKYFSYYSKRYKHYEYDNGWSIITEQQFNKLI